MVHLEVRNHGFGAGGQGLENGKWLTWEAGRGYHWGTQTRLDG